MDGILTAVFLFCFCKWQTATLLSHLSLPQISSIATHPSEPSAPAGITQYLSGAEDKPRATSHHLLPFNSP